MQIAPTLRTVLTPAAMARLALGWGGVVALRLAEPLFGSHLPAPLLAGQLAGVVAVIVVCAFGVVTQAEHLARRLGDPYGTLILTLSIAAIEVILISAVMLGPGEHTTIARDSVMAVSMIILNLVIGVALLVADMRHGAPRPNRTGVYGYLSLLVVLTTVTFALPGLIGVGGAYQPAQAIAIAGVTVLLYGFFLYRQMGPQREEFQEVAAPGSTTGPAASTPGGAPSSPSPAAPAPSPRPACAGEHPRTAVVDVISHHRAEIVLRALVLLLTAIPIVALSHDMAALLDDGLDRLGAPVALSGVLIAMIVFLPETITTIRAAHAGEIQRVSNLCHGALVSTVGLTVPAVLTIGLATGQGVVLAESPTNLLFIAVTLLLTITTFGGAKVTAVGGAAHLMVFALYGLTVFT